MMLAKSVASSVMLSIGYAVVVVSEPSPNKVPSKIATVIMARFI